MVKYVANCWHAAKIGFANEVGRVAKAFGVDGRTVMGIIAQDTKLNVSPAYMKPGFAYGGSCLPKDVRALLHYAQDMGVPLPMLAALPTSNQAADRRRASTSCWRPGLSRVAVFGLAFKSETDDLRESPAVPLVKRLLGEGCEVRIYAPDVNQARLMGTNLAYIRETHPPLRAPAGRRPGRGRRVGRDVVVVTHPQAQFTQALERGAGRQARRGPGRRVHSSDRNDSSTMASPGSVLIVVENLPVPFDRRVWMEATTLAGAGYDVTVISPKGKGFERDHEVIDGVSVYRHDLTVEGHSALTYLREYAAALLARGDARASHLPRRPVRRHPRLQPARPHVPLRRLVQAASRGPGRSSTTTTSIPSSTRRSTAGATPSTGCCGSPSECTFLTANVVITTGESYRDDRARARRQAAGGRVHRAQRPGPGQVPAGARRPPPTSGAADTWSATSASWGRRRASTTCCGPSQVIVQELGRDRHLASCSSAAALPSPSSRRWRATSESTDYVEFTGRVPDDELIARLSTCDVCVNPDPYNPFNDASVMNKILEYMALERPVVQFDLTEGRRSAGAARRVRPPQRRRTTWRRRSWSCSTTSSGGTAWAKKGYRRMRDELEWRHQVPKLLRAYARAVGNDATIPRPAGVNAARQGRARPKAGDRGDRS